MPLYTKSFSSFLKTASPRGPVSGEPHAQPQTQVAPAPSPATRDRGFSDRRLRAAIFALENAEKAQDGVVRLPSEKSPIKLDDAHNRLREALNKGLLQGNWQQRAQTAIQSYEAQIASQAAAGGQNNTNITDPDQVQTGNQAPQDTPPEAAAVPQPEAAVSQVAPPEAQKPQLAGTKAEQVKQLEDLYHQTWNYYARSVIPQMNRDTQQAQKLVALFQNVRPLWKSMRETIQQNPQIADQLNDQHIQAVWNTLNDAKSRMEQVQQYDNQIMNEFQSKLQRAFNAINQLANFNTAQVEPTGPNPGLPSGERIPTQVPQRPATQVPQRQPTQVAAETEPMLTAFAGSASNLLKKTRLAF